jgi:hypothetical protein
MGVLEAIGMLRNAGDMKRGARMTNNKLGLWIQLAVLAAVCFPLANAHAVPSAPTTLTAAAVSASRIDLRWVDTSTNERGFRIERRIGVGAWRQIATLGADATTFANVGLTPETTYSYRVRAYHLGGTSAASNIASATTPGENGTPLAPTELRATLTSASRVKLTWRDNSSHETLFKIERRIETRAWRRSGTVGANVTAYGETGLTASVRYSYRISACNGRGCSNYSNTVTVQTPPGDGITGRLNDTGIVRCADVNGNNLPCPVSGYPKQDAEYGRDWAYNDDSDGHAGFSFTKLDAKGNALEANAAVWSCVRDNVTGLVWEEKADDRGLRHKDWTYSWYNPNPSTNGGSAGKPSGGSCSFITECDTQRYVGVVNAFRLCGASDWRLPTVSELLSIVSQDRIGPAIDTKFFRNLPPGDSRFWSSATYARHPEYAWIVSSDHGYVEGNLKTYVGRVRLVRGGR